MALNAQYIKACRARKEGNFSSRRIGKSRKITAILPKAAQEIWEYAQDDLKASMGNQADSAMFLPSSLNIYFGKNRGVGVQGIQRYAYGTGSGSSTIGLDSTTMRIHQMTGTLIDLSAEVTKLMAAKSSNWAEWLSRHPINVCAVKAYYMTEDGNGETFKSTGFHRDVTYSKRTRQPMTNNSQVPGTPVAMLTFGATKNLWFQRFNGKVKDHGSLIHLVQQSGCLTILDGRDEVPDEDGWAWKHRADMCEATGITFVFTFRSVQNWVYVLPDGRLANPVQSKTRKRKFQESGDLFNNKRYKQMREDLEARMVEFLHLQDHKLAHKAEQDTADLRKGVNLLLKLKFLSNN